MSKSFIFKSLLYISLLLLLCSTVTSAKEYFWESVPVTTIGDESKGRAGGEGFQVVEDIVFSPSNPKILYLSTNTSQVWKSIDSGATWNVARKGFKSHGASSLAVDGYNSDIVFAAGTLGRKEDFSFKLPNRFEGIYRTLDGGKNWQLVRKTHFNTVVNKGSLILIMPRHSNVEIPNVYAASHSEGLLKSSDFGETWKVINSDISSISDMAINHSKKNSIFIAAKEGLFLLETIGLRKIGSNFPGRPLSIATSRAKLNQVFISTNSYGVYKSLDGGATFKFSGALNAIVLEPSPVNANYLFSKRNQNKRRMPLYSHDASKSWNDSDLLTDMDPIFDKTNEQFWFSSPFAAHPTNSNIVFTVSNGKGRIIKSTDAGRTWKYSGNGFTGGRMQDIAFNSDGSYLFAFTDHGIWKNNDTSLNYFKYLTTPRVFGARSVGAIDVDKNIIVAAIGTWGKKALSVSTDFGKTWLVNKGTSAPHKFIAIDPFDNKYIYAGNFISNDQGKTWIKSKFSIQAVDVKGRLYALKKLAKQTIVLQSLDRGQSWLAMAGELPVSIKKINDITVSNDLDPTIYLATNFGVYVIKSGKWKLKNEANGLNRDDYGLLVVSGVVVDPMDKNIVYATRRSPGYGQSNGVFQSINSGTTWVNITANLGPYLTVWSVKISPYTRDLFIGTSSGSFRLGNLNTD